MDINQIKIMNLINKTRGSNLIIKYSTVLNQLLYKFYTIAIIAL